MLDKLERVGLGIIMSGILTMFVLLVLATIGMFGVLAWLAFQVFTSGGVM